MNGLEATIEASQQLRERLDEQSTPELKRLRRRLVRPRTAEDMLVRMIAEEAIWERENLVRSEA